LDDDPFKSTLGTFGFGLRTKLSSFT